LRHGRTGPAALTSIALFAAESPQFKVLFTYDRHLLLSKGAAECRAVCNNGSSIASGE
jgi:hypothetical protein